MKNLWWFVEYFPFINAANIVPGDPGNANAAPMAYQRWTGYQGTTIDNNPIVYERIYCNGAWGEKRLYLNSYGTQCYFGFNSKKSSIKRFMHELSFTNGYTSYFTKQQMNELADGNSFGYTYDLFYFHSNIKLEYITNKSVSITCLLETSNDNFRFRIIDIATASTLVYTGKIWINGTIYSYIDA